MGGTAAARRVGALQGVFGAHGRSRAAVRVRGRGRGSGRGSGRGRGRGRVRDRDRVYGKRGEGGL